MTDIIRKKNTGEAGNAGEFGTHERTADNIALATPQDITTTIVINTEIPAGTYPLPELPEDLPEPEYSFYYGEDNELNVFLSFGEGPDTTNFSVWRDRHGDFTNSVREGVEETPWDEDTEDQVEQYARALHGRIETRLVNITDEVITAAGEEILASLGVVSRPEPKVIAPIVFNDDGTVDVSALSEEQSQALFDALSRPNID